MKRDITIVDEGTAEDIGDGLLEVFVKPYLLNWLKDRGVKFVTEVRCKEITEKGLVVINSDGVERLIRADTIITALPLKAGKERVESLRGKVEEVYAIGDVDDPGYIVDAIAAGAKIGHSI